MITTLQQAISRTHNPLRPVVLTIGQISGGRAWNAIADRVKLVGTVRSLHPETHGNLPDWIENIVANLCQTYGAKYEMNYQRLVPSVLNDPTLTQLVQTATEEAWGNSSIEIIPEPSLGAEDFSMYLDHAPGMMFRLGVGHKERSNHPLHHPQFDIDESATIAGVVTLAYAAYKYWHSVHL